MVTWTKDEYAAHLAGRQLEKPAKRTHKSEIEAVRRLIKAAGGRSWVLHQVGRVYGDAGLPDVFCVRGGEAFWIEVKVAGDKLRPAQVAFIEALEETAVRVIVGGVERVATYLKMKVDRRT